jgi:hypothetical protein
VIDGHWLRNMAVLEYQAGRYCRGSVNVKAKCNMPSLGNYWKNLDSIIISHMKDEGSMFSPKVKSENEFDQFLNGMFRFSGSAMQIIKQKYASISNVQDRVNRIVSDSTFLCNIPPILKAFSNNSWLLQYTRGAAQHGNDIPAFYHNPEGWPDLLGAMTTFGDREFKTFAPTLQSYITDYAIMGDPNKQAAKSNQVMLVNWPRAVQTGDSYVNVLDAGDKGFSIVNSRYISIDVCNAWMAIATIVVGKGGYESKISR